MLLVGLLLAGQHASAQEWALKMFDTTSHDFGAVAKGSKAEFRFLVKNIYQEDAHILGVKSSCNCTAPRISKRDLKSLETAEIIAEFNTRDFQGYRTATLTVTLDCVSQAVIQLHVAGFIRRDVVLQPGALDWGTVDLGTPVEKTLQVSYAGRDDWRIVDVKTADPHFEVEISQPTRGGGRVSYELLVRLTKDAPVGYIKDQLVLVTNDAQARELPVDMEGRIVPDITISPTKWFIGVVHPGQKVSKQLLVRGKKPFKIIDVKCADKSFTIEPSKESKAVHLIPVVFTAGQDAGRVTQKISIQTDQGDNVVPAFTAFAEVVKPDPVEKAKPVETEDSSDEAAPPEKTKPAEKAKPAVSDEEPPAEPAEKSPSAETSVERQAGWRPVGHSQRRMNAGEARKVPAQVLETR
jgi:hypothetical protein